MRKHILKILILISVVFFTNHANAQLSPGELSKAHSHLEGLSNCTKCHILGKKETTSKCLECHKEIQTLINKKRGYHSSEEVKGKKCAECHGEHFGRNFQIIRFNEKTFNHSLTGFKLEGKHTKINCNDCHKPELVKQKISQKKGNSYLGSEPKCLSCHADYHQNTLSSNCVICHTNDAFKPAPGFNHSKTRFSLLGKHQTVKCESCHKIELSNGIKFQKFAKIEFSSCKSCHTDVHKNKFGDDCRKCHNENSFHEVNRIGAFNHEKTDYPLRGSHQNVDCKKCHTKSLTAPLKYEHCTDCHTDYHEKQFVKNGKSPDCAECHTVEKFSPSLYNLEKHNKSNFTLEGSHLATPCFSCHKKSEKWNFVISGKKCIDCHENIHKNYLNEKFIPEGDCKSCHSLSTWTQINFNHSTTKFELSGKHTGVNCRKCHFKVVDNLTTQQFNWVDNTCTNCHEDIHIDQFKENGNTNCERCHTNMNWNPDKFDHSLARFKLDGKHKSLDCIKCHKPANDLNKKYIVYKFKDISCKSCH